MGGPGTAYLEAIGLFVFLVYEFVHVFKNVQNNWLNVGNKELSFEKDGKMFTASWDDLKALYEEDCQTPQCLTNKTYLHIDFSQAFTKAERVIGLIGLQ